MNQVLAQSLARSGLNTADSDDFLIAMIGPVDPAVFESVVRDLNAVSARDLFDPPAQLGQSLKFSSCLPPRMVADLLRRRWVSTAHLQQVVDRPRKVIVGK